MVALHCGHVKVQENLWLYEAGACEAETNIPLRQQRALWHLPGYTVITQQFVDNFVLFCFLNAGQAS